MNEHSFDITWIPFDSIFRKCCVSNELYLKLMEITNTADWKVERQVNLWFFVSPIPSDDCELIWNRSKLIENGTLHLNETFKLSFLYPKNHVLVLVSICSTLDCSFAWTAFDVRKCPNNFKLSVNIVRPSFLHLGVNIPNYHWR